MNDNNNDATVPHESSSPPPLLLTTTTVCHRLQTALSNLGLALRCHICLSTLGIPTNTTTNTDNNTDADRTPVVISTCNHAYCRGCILAALRAQQQQRNTRTTTTFCPICHQSAPRRSLQPSPVIPPLAVAYMRTLRHFGLVPVVYEPSLALTQLPTADTDGWNGRWEKDDDSDDDKDERKPAAQPIPVHNKSTTSLSTSSSTLVSVHQHVQVSRTFARALASTTTTTTSTTTPGNNNNNNNNVWWQKQQQRVVEANERALLQAMRQQQQQQSRQQQSKVPQQQQQPRQQQPQQPQPTTGTTIRFEESSTTRPAARAMASTITTRPDKEATTRTPTTTPCASRPATAQQGDPRWSITAPVVRIPPAAASSVAMEPNHGRTNRITPPTTTTAAATTKHHRVEAAPLENDTSSTTATTTSGRTDAEQRQDSDPANNTTALPPPPPPQQQHNDNRHTNSSSSNLPPGRLVSPLGGMPSRIPPTTTTTTAMTNTNRPRVSLVPTSADRPLYEPTLQPQLPQQPEEATTSSNNHQTTNTNRSRTVFAVGCLVQVQSRTWPGMNKRGGVATITAVHVPEHHHPDHHHPHDHHQHDPAISYNVAYVLGGKENRVPAMFVSPHDDLNHPRPRRTAARIQNHDATTTTIPPPLLQQLAAEGFDVGNGTTTTSAAATGAASGNHTRRKKRPGKENNTTDHGKLCATASKPKRHKREPPREIVPCVPNNNENNKNPTQALLPTAVEHWCQLADQYYQRRIQHAMNRKTLQVVASSLSLQDTHALHSLAKALKHAPVSIQITESFHANKTTLCIMTKKDARQGLDSANNNNNNNNTALVRTMKGMQAALAGVPIVTPAWIQACQMAQHVVMPDPTTMYIRTLPCKASVGNNTVVTDYGVARIAATQELAARQQQQQHRPLHPPPAAPPLANCHVFLQGVRQKRDAMFVLREAGATILSHAASVVLQLKGMSVTTTTKHHDPNAEQRVVVVVVCDDTTTWTGALTRQIRNHAAPQQVWVVNSGWVFDSVASGMPVAPEHYAVRGESKNGPPPNR